MNSGVYQIKNRLNGHRYIGSSVNVAKRWRDHLGRLRRTQHENEHLQRAFDKYGENLFVFSVLELADLETLIQCEQHYFDMLMPEYNVAKTAGSSTMLGRHHSMETRRRISMVKKGRPVGKEHRRRIGEARRGKHHSERTRWKIGLAQKGRHHTEETRRKMSEAQRARRAREAQIVNRGRG